jgi:DNA-binding transcriptional ArsR family regulator
MMSIGGYFPRVADALHRRPPTPAEAKALAHPVRLQILRLASARDLTNKQLADQLGLTPGTVLHHVRVLVRAGFLIPAPVRTGGAGALERPYRASGATWWLSDPLAGHGPDIEWAPLRSFLDDLAVAHSDELAAQNCFTLHLSAADITELERQLLAILDRWVASDNSRRDRPVHCGIVALLRLNRIPE